MVELWDYVRILRRRWWIIVLLTGAAGLLAYGVSKRLTPVYRAEGTLLLNLAQNATAPTYNEVTASQALTKTYAQIVSARSTLEEVALRLGGGVKVSALQGLSGTDVPLTELIRISYENPSRDFVVRVVNTASAVLVDRVRTAQQGDPESTSASPAIVNSLYIIDRAVVSPRPVFPRTALYTGLATVTGFLIAICLSVLLEYLDDVIHGAEELEHLGLTPMGAIRRSRNSSKSPLIITASELIPSRLVEEYRQLCANVEFAALDREIRTLVITSALPKEGRTTTAINLAIALAQTGRRVILVDGDMRRPAVHTAFNLDNGYGVTTALRAWPEKLDTLLQSTTVTGLRILTTGPLPPNPAELLASTKMGSLMTELMLNADLVVIDTPPCIALADAIILTGRADATLLVIDVSHTRSGAVRTALGHLSRSRTRVIGGVLNKAREKSDYYHRRGEHNSMEVSTLSAKEMLT